MIVVKKEGETFSTHDPTAPGVYGLEPMKVEILSDIHGDIVALDLALGHLRRMGCAPILCAGDLLDIEPFGEEVVQRIKAEKIVCIRGNHERWALERRRQPGEAVDGRPGVLGHGPASEVSKATGSLVLERRLEKTHALLCRPSQPEARSTAMRLLLGIRSCRPIDRPVE